MSSRRERWAAGMQRGPSSRRAELLGRAVPALVLVALFFGAAGTLFWLRGWLYLAALAAGLSVHSAYVGRKNPALKEARRRIGPGTRSWDLLWNLLFWGLMVATAALSGVETERAAHVPLPWWTFAAGLGVLGTGLFVSARAMAVNPFFESTVRIQSDRGQYVVDSGPYARVRHPGYVGLSLMALGGPLLLGSRWAFIPSALTVLWIAARTLLEDRMLQSELPGYAAYARRVRWRLLPFVF